MLSVPPASELPFTTPYRSRKDISAQGQLFKIKEEDGFEYWIAHVCPHCSQKLHTCFYSLKRDLIYLKHVPRAGLTEKCQKCNKEFILYFDAFPPLSAIMQCEEVAIMLCVP